MNREDIIRMAKEADLVSWLPNSTFSDGIWWIEAHEVGSELERFAALVASAERSACETLHDHEDVQAPIGNSSWGEAYQEGWAQGTAAYRDAIRARGQA